MAGCSDSSKWREGSVAARIGSWIFGLAAIALLGAFAVWVVLDSSSSKSGIMDGFPATDKESPWILMHTRGITFSLPLAARIVEEMMGTPMPEQIIESLVPDIKAMAVLLPMGEWSSFGAFGAFQIPASVISDYMGGKKSLGEFSLELDSATGAMIVKAKDGAPVGFLWSPGNDIIYFASTSTDIDLVKKAWIGEGPRLDVVWELEPDYDGHVVFNGGNAIPAASSDAYVPPRFHLAWDGKKKSGGAVAGEAMWMITGFENNKEWETVPAIDWNSVKFSMFSPPVLAAGANFPVGGLDAHLFSMIKGFVTDLEIEDANVKSLFSGPVVAGLGGRTSLLWFNLPGVMVDFPDKGAAGYALVDGVWRNYFEGARQFAVKGYDHGGYTDFPFAFVGVANSNDAVVALSVPSGILEVQNGSPPFMGLPASGIAWIYADLPRLGDAVSEMMKLSNVMSSEDPGEDLVSNESGQSFKKMLGAMRPVLLLFDSPYKGTLRWYM